MGFSFHIKSNMSERNDTEITGNPEDSCKLAILKSAGNGRQLSFHVQLTSVMPVFGTLKQWRFNRTAGILQESWTLKSAVQGSKKADFIAR